MSRRLVRVVADDDADDDDDDDKNDDNVGMMLTLMLTMKQWIVQKSSGRCMLVTLIQVQAGPEINKKNQPLLR